MNHEQIQQLYAEYKEAWRQAVVDAGGDPAVREDYFLVPRERGWELQNDLAIKLRSDLPPMRGHRKMEVDQDTGEVRPESMAVRVRVRRDPNRCGNGHDLRGEMDDGSGKSIRYFAPSGSVQCRMCKREARIRREQAKKARESHEEASLLESSSSGGGQPPRGSE